jgi:hypothetical protein
MSVTIKNAAPRPILTGFKDESGRALPVVREAIPQHLPLLYLQTQRGPLTPQLVAGRDMLTMFGTSSFEERSKYFSHQTMVATTCNGNGNVVMIKRVIAANAAKASLVLYVEIVADDLPAYSRESDGEVIRDASGAKVLSGSTIDGYRLAWSVAPLADVDNLRGEFKSVGTLAGRTGEVAQRYPVMAFRMGYGEYGNNVGVRLSFPGPATAMPTDTSVIESQRAMIYRGQYVEREDEFSLPRIQSSLNAEQYVEFALKENVINPKTDMDLGISRLMDDYQAIDPSTGFMPVYGPVEAMYVYQENIDEIVTTIFAKEELANPGGVADKWMINIMSALDYNGIDHYALQIDTSSLDMNEDTTHYGIGGSDGDVDEATLDTLVRAECLYNWENIDYPLVDTARFPFSILYDSGFSLETKKAVIGTIGYRKEISVGACTQDVLEKANSISEETSIMTALRAYARLLPESTLWGTPVTRVTVLGHTGDKLYSKYKRQVPLLMELVEKRSKYMGAGEGKMKTQFAYDVSPYNRVETMINVNHPWKPDRVRSKDWELGLNWVQHADRSQLFFPALQTVYDDDTSVLNSDINMLICVDVAKQSEEVWRRMTGNTTLTNAQFIDKCNAELLKLVEGRYDNRVVIVPNTYFTEADEARGYSWTMDVAVYMNNMRTVGVLNVITRRRSDL